MDTGGIESWLMQILRRVDPNSIRMDFLVSGGDSHLGNYDYEQELSALGARIFRCPHPEHPLAYARGFRNLLSQYGPYDVVHSHVDHYSGYAMWLAKLAGVTARVAHSHLDIRNTRTSEPAHRWLYLATMKHLIKANATAGFATSASAAASLFGERWQRDNRWKLLYCGIDITPFTQIVNKAEVRASLGIPEGAMVLGHAGRFAPQKNHTFLLQVAAEVAQRVPNMRLLLLGEGPLRREMELEASKLGISDRSLFAGTRPDVPRLMLGAMDAFIFPSLFEGLGLALVEAQAAGLPCLAANTVPEEADIVSSLVRRLSLDQSPATWADALIDMCKHAPTMSTRAQALSAVEASPLNLLHGLDRLVSFYEGCSPRLSPIEVSANGR
jgi:glycosyltransferase involved in cell wall biosynthesis